MSVVRFPTKMPSPDQIDLAQAHLSSLLQDMANRSLARCNQVLTARNAPELARLINEAAQDAAGDAAGWASLLKTVKDSWGISG